MKIPSNFNNGGDEPNEFNNSIIGSNSIAEANARMVRYQGQAMELRDRLEILDSALEKAKSDLVGARAKLAERDRQLEVVLSNASKLEEKFQMLSKKQRELAEKKEQLEKFGVEV